MGKRGKAPGRHGERDLGIIRRYQGGETLEAIGKSLDLTRERIRQILWRELGREGASGARRAARVSQRAIAQTRLPLGQCIVCWSPMPTDGRGRGGIGRSITCGPECHADYQVVGYQIDPQRRANQQMRTARWVAKNRQHVKPHQARYYAKILTGSPIKRRGQWINSDKVRLVMERVMAKRALAQTDWHVEFPQPADIR